jgi:hypothetical protein
MQDIQNIPNPDVNSTVRDDDFGTHPDREETDVENIPLPPDEQKPAPIEEPPETEKPPVEEDQNEPKRIL